MALARAVAVALAKAVVVLWRDGSGAFGGGGAFGEAVAVTLAAAGWRLRRQLRGRV